MRVSGRSPAFTAADAWAVLTVRLALIVLAALAGGLLLLAANGRWAFPPGSMIATWTILPVNVLTWVVVIRTLRRRGTRVRDMLVPGPRGIGIDVLWGFVWLAALYLPFAGALIGTLAIFEPDPFAAFETAFASPSTLVDIPAAIAPLVAVVGVVLFAPVNAPVEELAYRGIAQRGLGGWAGVVVPSVAFGFQHLWFAATWSAAAAMFAAFTVWGLGSALIARWQGRLLPIVIAHFVVNVLTSAPALLFLFIDVG
ncbi:CPBP family intramembrane glutamic endopeptidase [Microbacterium halophytorum]|uniref:CPBP family intramembrane glutamic endopeptidase n=1 Tax=Microbacterium halophytorum TaxID=2067568 RepID=UPI000CFB94CE|nr:CPBP family intramembrane glutamic endopeptidase [Microbacterium halophytorum]